MAKIHSVSIDLTKIDKSKIQEKDGKKWYSIQIVENDEVDKFGNTVAVLENQSKEEREAKKPKTYLGNGKTVWSSGGITLTHTPPQTTDNSLPF